MKNKTSHLNTRRLLANGFGILLCGLSVWGLKQLPSDKADVKGESVLAKIQTTETPNKPSSGTTDQQFDQPNRTYHIDTYRTSSSASLN